MLTIDILTPDIYSTLRNIIATIVIAIGIFFMIMGSIGLLKLPDFYTRLHAAGKCDTVGLALIIMGCMIYQGLDFITIKLLFVLAFYLFTIPVGTHAIMKAAYRTGVKIWKKGDSRM